MGPGLGYEGGMLLTPDKTRHKAVVGDTHTMDQHQGKMCLSYNPSFGHSTQLQVFADFSVQLDTT